MKKISHQASMMPAFLQRIIKRMYVRMISAKREYFHKSLSFNESKMFTLFKLIIFNEDAKLDKGSFAIILSLHNNTYRLDTSSKILSIEHDDYSSQFHVSDILIHKIQVVFDSAIDLRNQNQKIMHSESQGRTLDAIIFDVKTKNK